MFIIIVGYDYPRFHFWPRNVTILLFIKKFTEIFTLHTRRNQIMIVEKCVNKISQ